MPNLAVVIVTWNVRDLVLNALDSLYIDLEASGLSSEVYVVDNASSDGTAEAISEAFPQVMLLTSENNLGFGGANNYALRLIGFGQSSNNVELPDVVYLLNPDTVTQPGATRALYDVLVADQKLGMVGAYLFNGDGSFQHGAFRFPGLRQLWVEFFPTPGRFIEGGFNGRYSQVYYQGQHPFPVDFTLGATMMLKREVIQQTGMFDEAFFMYCEEVDWAWRIRKAGWEIACVPSAHVTHLVGQSTSQIRPRSLEYLWTSRLKLFEKHYPRWKLFFARQMVVLGMQRKIKQVYRDDSLDEPTRQQLINAYQKVRRLALGR